MILKKDVSDWEVTAARAEDRTDRLEQGHQWDSWHLLHITTNVTDTQNGSVLSSTC